MTITQPAATLTLSGGNPASGGLGAAVVTLVGTSAGPTGTPGTGGTLDLAAGAVRRLRVDLSVDEAHDRVQLWLWRSSALSTAQPGDTLSVALGTGSGAPQDVLRVDVATVEQGPGGVLVTGLAPSHRLSYAHVGRSWRLTTLGQVVRDLLADGGVDAGDVAATLALPALHVDPRRTVWSALHDLARRTGHQVTSTADGKVSFGAAPGVASSGAGGLLAAAASAVGALGSAAELREGADLLAYAAGPHLARTALQRVNPAGAASWFLLAAEPDDGSAVQLVDPALRTREAADAGSAGAAAAASRAARSARMRVIGRPGLRAGVTLRANGGSYRVLRVTHLVDADVGYVADLTLEGDR